MCGPSRLTGWSIADHQGAVAPRGAVPPPVYMLKKALMLGVSQHMDPKLFGREIIFEEFQRMWSRYLIVTDRRTDGRTDGQATYCRITALCASIAR